MTKHKTKQHLKDAALALNYGTPAQISGLKKSALALNYGTPAQISGLKKSAIDLIAAERQEQIEKHGRTIEGDVVNNDRGQLGFAVVAMASESDVTGRKGGNESQRISHFAKWKPIGWDHVIWLKMISKPYRERLIIAGALIAAEIDRLDNQQKVELGPNE